MKTEREQSRISRRDIIKWFTAAAAVSQFGPALSFGQGAVGAEGYGQDPKVAGIFKPGDHWPLTLTSSQRKTVTALADTILPEDEYGPAASSLRVPDFVDEWVSAPYPRQQAARKKILPGLKDIEELSLNLEGERFSGLSLKLRAKLLDRVTGEGSKDALAKRVAGFLHEFTSICMGAYYGTPAGWKAIGYVGNVPSPTFNGPPQEVLDRVGVTQTVK
ncbi:gluconate 2-dehydrogenase subunit 3 family protein [Pelagicoccus mobilis]|uniref:Gluconate 2-dehydrogenase subunit 3 family protein n=1 Tax=Pelagicoccus mobilis TaxID=415221 RepID=A0A934VSZ5_9BACT|nr:gluconate 2-dehydrogenase subunit 3 family protein [Pelagicoccus mobilis]MBK1879004.1 gluconate 2-dehydrogenase subunit 3 family protein [Pelagicoccus mobilis]